MGSIAKLLRNIAASLSLLLILFALTPAALAQETTGGLGGTIKDATGATIADATVTVSGTQLIGDKIIRTDKTGYYRFTNLPPGEYAITVNAPGFSETRREKIILETGHLPIIDIALSIGSDRTVVEVSTETPQIDVTQSRSQTNVTRDEIDYDPRGRSFQSVIQFAPGARNEPLQANGYSIDGATSSENGYLIDGMQTSALDSGQSKANLPFEFIQEVQIKTSGFEAEFGGALGGVVTAVQRRGSNNFHGELLTYYEADPLDASPPTANRFQPGVATPTTRFDLPIQNYNSIKDHFRYLQPGAIAGGPLVKDRLWASGGFEPLFTSQRRTVNFNYVNGAVSIIGPQIFSTDTQQYFSYIRLDGKLTDKIRLFGAYTYQYYRASGTALPNSDNLGGGLLNTSSTSNPNNFNHGIGNVQPNLVATTGADITINSNLVATTRYGYFYNNYHDVGTPIGIRDTFSNTGTGVVALDKNIIVAGNPAAQPAGYANIGANTATTATQNVSHQFNQDIAYYKKGFFGQHNFKVGYQLNHQFYNIRQNYQTALVQLSWGQTYSPLATNQANCAAIENANVAQYGTSGTPPPAGQPATTIDPTACRGNYGVATIRDFTNGNGQVSENNHGLYVQDAWTVGHGLTLNLGVRFEKEKVPSFNLYPSGIDFGLGGKIAPRLGGAYDVFQNGKMKLFGSYGVFNDVFKLNLAIGSFGGNYWHNCIYALDTPNFAAIQPVRDANGHYCSGTGGANFAGGTTPSNLRFIENQDFRIAANDPANPIQPGVDPNLQPFRQHESVFGADYQISRNWSFESRWTRRRVDHAIEDTGILTPAGEAFPISNPGEGIDTQPVPNCPNCYNQPKAARAYDGVEFRFTKVQSAHWFGQFDYTYSKLRGNYSGLVDSDVADGNATTTTGIRSSSPNNGRAFDEPFFQFTAAGKPFNGLLATDRPHTFKAITYYRMAYLRRHESSVGLFQQIYSGTPLSSYIDVAGSGSYEVYPEGRGLFVPATADPGTGVITYGTPFLRRTPVFFQSDISFTHSYKVSNSHDNWRLGFEANINNALNTKRPVIFGTKLDSPNKSNFIKPVGYLNADKSLNYATLERGYDYKNLTNNQAGTPITLNAQYGVPTGFQTGRSIRLKAKFTF